MRDQDNNKAKGKKVTVETEQANDKAHQKICQMRLDRFVIRNKSNQL